MVWYSHLLKNFPRFVVIHTVKGFGIVNKAEVDVFLELSCFFDDPLDVGNLISGSSTFSKLRDLILKACWGDDIFLSCHALISSDGSNIYSNPSGESVSCGNI